MDGVRLLGEWTYQYKLMVEGIAVEQNGHWNIDEAMADFKDLILECCADCQSGYEVLIPTFKELASSKRYSEAQIVGLEIYKMITNMIRHKFPNI